MSNNMTSGNSG